MGRILFVLIWTLIDCSSLQANAINLSIANWHAEQVEAENLRISFDLTNSGIIVNAYAEKVSLPGPISQLKNVRLECQSLVFEEGDFNCRKGVLAFKQRDIGKQRWSFTIQPLKAQQGYQLSLANINIANNRLRADAIIKEDRWQVQLSSAQSSLSTLLDFAEKYLAADYQEQFSQWQFEDKATFNLALYGSKQIINKAKLELDIDNLNVSENEGLYATESLRTKVTFDIKNNRGKWYWQSAIDFTAGQAYLEPIFFDFDENQLSLKGQGSWERRAEILAVEKLVFNHADVMSGLAKFRLQGKDISSLEVQINDSVANDVYQNWIQPFTVGTAVDNLTLVGNFALDYQQNKEDFKFTVFTDNISVEDSEKRFSVDDLSGHFAWTTYEQPLDSQLSWHSAKLFAIPLGQSDFKASAKSAKLRATEPWSISILDGELTISSLDLFHNQTATAWTFDGLLKPISMESLSESLEWPLLHGKLSGVIPKVSYQDKKIDIDGALMVKLFQGTAIFKDLRIERPFDTLPQLYGNIDLSGLDLETITQTFEFGKITGKLDGKVENLRLSNWQPVYFDASIATPIGDKSRRRISQQAIDNLSQVGGGPTGILSRSFLRFFEDFSYQKIGLSCKLRNEVCTISGVEETDNAYYIVKGGGLPPRINVMGYTRRVDWPELISRLKAVSNSSGAVIK